MPLYHYWPIREEEKCRDIKFAVFWGNSHKKKVILISLVFWKLNVGNKI